MVAKQIKILWSVKNLSPPDIRLTKNSVLIVDDEEILLKLLGRFLEQQKWDVLTAANGSDALKIYRGNPNGFCLVILDLYMPYLSGLELYHNIRKLNKQQRVLITSGNEEKFDVEDHRADVYLRFIRKPFNRAAFLKMVEELVPLC